MQKSVPTCILGLGHVFGVSVVAHHEDRELGKSHCAADVLAQLVAGLVWQPNINAGEMNVSHRQVAGGGVVMACFENIQPHLPELPPDGLPQLWVVLHDK